MVGEVEDNNDKGNFMATIGWKIIASVVLVLIVIALSVSIWFAKKTEDATTKTRRSGTRFRSDEKF